MAPSITLALVSGVLFGTGVVLLLSKAITRALIGVLLMSNGANLFFLIASGRPGKAPIVTDDLDVPIGAEGVSDPLPQAMVLTAIVITLAVTAFTLALAHRSLQVQSTDVIADDDESSRTHDRAVANDFSDSDYLDASDPYSVDEEPEPAADEESESIDAVGSSPAPPNPDERP